MLNEFARMGNKMRKNVFYTWKRVSLFITGVAVLLVLLGCASGPALNYYNLGNVSEENCALIVVSPVSQIYDAQNRRFLKSDYGYSDFVKVDGQGDDKQWQKPPSEGILDVSTKKAVVRVTPGVHTFTITFFFNEEYEVPLDFTYDCKEGKAYSFEFLVQDPYDLTALSPLNAGSSLGILNATVIINEADINEKGNFGGFATTFTEVGRKTGSFNFNSAFRPNDRGLLVKRSTL
jgi:hypothetical protein